MDGSRSARHEQVTGQSAASPSISFRRRRNMRILLATILLSGIGCQSVGHPSLAMLDIAGKRRDAKVVKHMQKSQFPTPAEVGLQGEDANR